MGYDIGIYNKEENTDIYYDFKNFSIGSINANLLNKIFECSWFPISIIQDMSLKDSTNVLTQKIKILENFKTDKQYNAVKQYLNLLLKYSKEYPNASWNIS
jgi:hypothetical protein